MERANSPAYAALTKSTRKVLGAIEAAIGDKASAAVTYSDLMFTHHIGRPSISKGLKALDALGMIDIEPGPRAGNVFRLSNRWRTINANEAARLSREARKLLPQRRHERRRVPVQPPPQQVIEPVATDGPVPFMERRPPSLPPLNWLGR